MVSILYAIHNYATKPHTFHVPSNRVLTNQIIIIASCLEVFIYTNQANGRPIIAL